MAYYHASCEKQAPDKARMNQQRIWPKLDLSRGKLSGAKIIFTSTILGLSYNVINGLHVITETLSNALRHRIIRNSVKSSFRIVISEMHITISFLCYFILVSRGLMSGKIVLVQKVLPLLHTFWQATHHSQKKFYFVAILSMLAMLCSLQKH